MKDPFCPRVGARRPGRLPTRSAAPWAGPLALLMGLLACSGQGDRRYLTETAQVACVEEQVSANGQVEARTKVKVGSQVSGTVQRVLVRWHDKIKAGQVLAELDPRLFVAKRQRAQASVQLARANVAKARAELATKQRAHGRMDALHQQQLVAAAEVDGTLAAREGSAWALEAAQAALAQAQADFTEADTQLALTKIVSPIDGVVLDRLVDAGQTVAQSMQVATLFVVAEDLRQLWVVAHVDEADVGRLHPGQAVSFRVAAYPHRTFGGQVREVRPAPVAPEGQSAAGGAVTYAAVIEANNADEALLEGMTAEVSAVVAKSCASLRVPAAALRWTPGPAAAGGLQGDSGQPGAKEPAGDAASAPPEGTVYTLVNGRPKGHAVRLGLMDGAYASVLSGLGDGRTPIEVVVGEVQTDAPKASP